MQKSEILKAARWLRRRAENIAAILLVTMFVCFIIQIGMRYVVNYPVAWTEETSILTWMWCVLWGAVFVLRERDEVRFDIIYSSASERTRRIFTIITGVAAIALFTIALPASYKYVAFMRVEKSAYLRIRLDIVYSIYVIFSVALIVRYAALVWQAWKGKAPDIAVGSGSAL